MRRGVLIDAHDEPLAGWPRPGDCVGLHVREELLIDPLSGSPQRELAQGRQIAG